MEKRARVSGVLPDEIKRQCILIVGTHERRKELYREQRTAICELSGVEDVKG